jgi:hypothetical protein
MRVYRPSRLRALVLLLLLVLLCLVVFVPNANQQSEQQATIAGGRRMPPCICVAALRLCDDFKNVCARMHMHGAAAACAGTYCALCVCTC